MKMLINLFFLSLCSLVLSAAERPNILWITSEDNDWRWLGCYGNEDAHTPRLDALAERGVLFNHAYSNAPVCAVARSTIVNGLYAVTQGTQHMRSRHVIPAYQSYAKVLRQQGYYCTNRAKTDYNFAGDDRAIWDACSGKAHYKNRPEGTPFFAVFNSITTHESALFEKKIKDRRRRGILPVTPSRDPSRVFLRPYLPDLPAVRQDIAIYHDTMTAYDKEVGCLLDDLKKHGLDQDTIIFYYSDHGGITPRGKRYLKDSGVHVPLIVYVPEKWQHLSPFRPGQKVDELVSFVDLAPTALSLAGAEVPAEMQGRAFMGTQRVEPAKEDSVFLFADRFDEFYGMRRGITDGRWKYIRRFTPHLAAAPYSEYQFGQAGWRAWQSAWKEGRLKGRQHSIWQAGQPMEELFDTQSDPWEIKNLATDSAHTEQLLKMRLQLKSKMQEVRDSGLIPEPMFHEVSPQKPIAHYMQQRQADLPKWIDLAFAASSGDIKNRDLLASKLQSKDPVVRYWALQGCLILGAKSEPLKKDIMLLLKDESSSVRVSSAQILAQLGQRNLAIDALLAELSLVADLTQGQNQYTQQNALNVLLLLQATDRIPDAWLATTLSSDATGKYVRWIAERVSLERK